MTPLAVVGRVGGHKRRPKSWPTASVTASIAFVALMVVCALLHGVLLSGALHQDNALGALGPGASGHLFGTDQLGRDVLELALAGARSALVGPLIIALGSMMIGVALGGMAGFRRGALDAVAGRYADLLLALPAVLLAIVVAGVLGGGYWVSVAVLIVLFSASDVRQVRGAVIEQSARPYIESARVSGIRPIRILVRHVLPNVVPVVLANALLNVAFALVALSSLSYLGLGVAPGTPDWGRQLADSRELLADSPMAAVLPGLLIIATATAVNLIGDWAAETMERRVASR